MTTNVQCFVMICWMLLNTFQKQQVLAKSDYRLGSRRSGHECANCIAVFVSLSKRRLAMVIPAVGRGLREGEPGVAGAIAGFFTVSRGEHGDAGGYAATGISSTSRSMSGYQPLKMALS